MQKNILTGMIVYAIGDSVATLILHQFDVWRCLGITLVGGFLYSIEVPKVFAWIDTFVKAKPYKNVWLIRTVLAIAYFNPLWIARHMLFIRLFSGDLASVNWQMLNTATKSFIVNIPISILGNYLIQNKIPLKHRFLASSIFSALMAISYAIGEIYF